jgi:thioredoxin reductase (NADPH)
VWQASPTVRATGQWSKTRQPATLVGERNSWHAARIRGFLDRNIHPYRWVDSTSPEGAALLEVVPKDERDKLPVVICPDGSALVQPTNVRLARELGIASRPSSERYDLVIVGAGPAGLATAVYGSSEGLSTALIEREAPGGQAGSSSRIENYLGFHEGISGADLTREATMQARRFGAEFVQPTEAVSLEAADDGHRVHLSDHAVLGARSVVIATGVEWRRLRAPGVAELIGLGVHYGAHPRDADDLVDQEVFIVGGANSAGQAAVAFSKPARKVTMLIRAGSLEKGMSRYLIEEIEARPNIEVMTQTELSRAHGHRSLESISVTRGGEPVDTPLRADNLFILIGAQPHTTWLEGTLARDERGFILTGRDLGAGAVTPAWPLHRDPHALETSMPGVFAAGDTRYGSIKRVASAVGEGSMAAQLIHQYFAELG